MFLSLNHINIWFSDKKLPQALLNFHQALLYQMYPHVAQESVQAEKTKSQKEQLDDDELYRMLPKVIITALVGNGPSDNVAYKPGKKD